MEAINQIIFEHQEKSAQLYKQQTVQPIIKKSKVEELLGTEFSNDPNYTEVKKKDRECSLFSFLNEPEAH